MTDREALPPGSAEVAGSGPRPDQRSDREAQIALGEYLARALRAGRRRLGWSQRDLAARGGLSKSVVARLEVGDARASVGSVRRALAAVGLTLAVLDREGQLWTGVLAIEGDGDGACDRQGRRLPAHWYEEPSWTGEDAWRISRRLRRGGPVLGGTDQPWTYRHVAWPPGDRPWSRDQRPAGPGEPSSRRRR